MDFESILAQIFDMKDPAARAALIEGLFKTAGGAVSMYGQGQMEGQRREDQLGQSKAGTLLGMAQMDEDHAQNQQRLEQAGLAQALGSLGSPLNAARDRGSFAANREFLFGGPGGSPQYVTPGAGSRTRMPNLPNLAGAAPFFSNDAMLQSETPYWEAMQGISQGRVGAGDLTKAGYGTDATAATSALSANRQGALDLASKREADYASRSANTRNAVLQALEQGDEKKGNWFSKLMNIGKFAVPFIPGVGPVAAGLMAGGMGAAGSLAEGGGVSGALVNGAMSGVGGYGMDKFLGGLKGAPGFMQNPTAQAVSGVGENTLPWFAQPGAAGGTPAFAAPRPGINADALRKGLNANTAMFGGR